MNLQVAQEGPLLSKQHGQLSRAGRDRKAVDETFKQGHLVSWSAGLTD